MAKKKKTKAHQQPRGTTSDSNESQVAESDLPQTLPLLAVDDIVPLPGVIIPFFFQPGANLEAVNCALERNSPIALLLYKKNSAKGYEKEHFSRIGTFARVSSFVRLPGGEIKVHFHVLGRIKVVQFLHMKPFVEVKVQYFEPPVELVLTVEGKKLMDEVKEKFNVLSQFNPMVHELVLAAQEIFSPDALADLVCSALPLDVHSYQNILEERDGVKRLKLANNFLNGHLDAAAIKERISGRAEKELGRLQHEEILREQLRQIQAELGEVYDYEDELSELKTRLKQAKLPAHAKKEAEKQLRRLRQLHPDSSEAALARTYLDWILDLPWSKRSHDKIDLTEATKILDEDHFGLEKAKERILDFLGVRKLRKGSRGPILLFVGPPGVGKTSLGRSIARALGREFIRVSVGGLRDEAELRGHRRTYVGALPGRIIQGLNTVGTRNPVFMLDELDKVGSDFRGDPASVLLEILDPEQNKTFEDHYLSLAFDLSEVIFIGTANITDSIPTPLLDRMETIQIAGYTNEEKRQIARRYIIPREKVENGLAKVNCLIGDKALQHIINGYTRESGVREFQRNIAAVFRKVARTIAEGKKPVRAITPQLVEKFLGPVHYVAEERLKKDEVGIVTGLAWTAVGGETLMVEVSITKGKGTLSLTGQLGEVMRESAMAALTYVLSRAEDMGIDPGFYEHSNVHVHVPHGAIPKDGPSAGVAIATALVSVLSGRPVSRNVAMTGEITLRGNVIEIGGLKEKALAALRLGIPTVIIPKDNLRELVEYPKYLTEKVKFVAVVNLDEVLAVALKEKIDFEAAPKSTDIATVSERKLRLETELPKKSV